ncbi:MAG: hypothetical protein R3C45_18090 [Phycisphaerales bacterium]
MVTTTRPTPSGPASFAEMQALQGEYEAVYATMIRPSRRALMIGYMFDAVEAELAKRAVIRACRLDVRPRPVTITDMHRVPVYILAGGKSSRFGSDKARGGAGR